MNPRPARTRTCGAETGEAVSDRGALPSRPRPSRDRDHHDRPDGSSHPLRLGKRDPLIPQRLGVPGEQSPQLGRRLPWVSLGWPWWLLLCVAPSQSKPTKAALTSGAD